MRFVFDENYVSRHVAIADLIIASFLPKVLWAREISIYQRFIALFLIFDGINAKQHRPFNALKLGRLKLPPECILDSIDHEVHQLRLWIGYSLCTRHRLDTIINCEALGAGSSLPVSRNTLRNQLLVGLYSPISRVQTVQSFAILCAAINSSLIGGLSRQLDSEDSYSLTFCCLRYLVEAINEGLGRGIYRR